MLEIALEKGTVLVDHPFELFGVDDVKSVIAVAVFLQLGYLFEKQLILLNLFLLCSKIFFLKVGAKVRSSNQALDNSIHVASIA